MMTSAPIDGTPPTFLSTLVQTLLPHLPPSIQEEAIAAWPTMRRQLERLGLEVLEAEEREISYAAAVRQPHFPLMAGVYFGAQDLLRWRVPPEIRDALKPLLVLAAEGRLDSTRQIFFALARDRKTTEAAIGRFFLWCALLVNLRIHTWAHPQSEALGVLSVMGRNAEQRLKELLDVPDIYESDVRPLNVIVLGLLEHVRFATETVWRVLSEELGVGLQELLQKAEALRETRRLTARDAAVLESRLLEPAIGSQQLADRYPQHYPTAQAVDNQRARVLKKLSAGDYDYVDDRVIDLLQPSGVSK